MDILNKLRGRGGEVQPLEKHDATPVHGRSAICSGCGEVTPENDVNVLPCFNEDLDNFVTTYRCMDCWMEALNDTALRLVMTDDDKQIASIAGFFEASGIVLLEYRRGDPIAEVRIALLQLLNKLRTGALTLNIGYTEPFDNP